MSITVQAHHYREWESWGLADDVPGDGAVYVNQVDYGDHSVGAWFAAPEAPVYAPADRVPFRVIYSGTFGNYNSPGASHYTQAELYDTSDPNDMEAYARDLAKWEGYPEWVDTGDDEAPEPDDDDEPAAVSE